MAVASLQPREAGGFLLETSAGPVEARAVVLATGAFQRPTRLPSGSTLPTDLLRLDIGDYRNPTVLPDGPVLVVGSGQSGCQIAEELAEAGRDVYLSCGRAPWLPRRIGDHDFVWWLKESGFLDMTVDSLPEPRARLWANVLASGRNGGHDLHLRTLHERGVVLLGHLAGIDGRRARFRPDLSESLAWGDQRYAQLLELFGTFAAESGIPKPESAEPAPLDHDAIETLDLKGFAAVVLAGGFRPDYGSWVRVPGAFDELGFPIHEDGASRVAPGLYFVGVHFLRKRKSSIFLGVGEDAAVVARKIAETTTGSV
jgi:putative flavoprotein involved in K+ transport